MKQELPGAVTAESHSCSSRLRLLLAMEDTEGSYPGSNEVAPVTAYFIHLWGESEQSALFLSNLFLQLNIQALFSPISEFLPFPAWSVVAGCPSLEASQASHLPASLAQPCYLSPCHTLSNGILLGSWQLIPSAACNKTIFYLIITPQL